MINKESRFLELLRGSMLKARIDNSEFIEAFPINEQRNSTEHFANHRANGFISRFPFKNRGDLTKRDLSEMLRDIGESVVTDVLTALKGDISVDYMGHSRTNGQSLLLEASRGTRRGEMSINAIARALGFQIGINILNMPKELPQDFGTKAIFEMVYNIFDVEVEDCMDLVSDSIASCSCCGDDLKPLLNVETLEVKLYPTIDNLSDEVFTTIEPRKCPHPSGIGSYSNSILTPSKKVVVANDLRSILRSKGVVTSDEYLESISGNYSALYSAEITSVYISEYYVKHHNMMYAPSGDGCSSLFQDKVTKQVKAKAEFYYDQVTGVEVKNYSDGEELVGDVIFDLWAICAMDYEQFESLCKLSDPCKSVDDWISELNASVVDMGRSCIEFTNRRFSRASRHDIVLELA